MPLPAPPVLLTGGRCRPQRPWGSSSLPPYQKEDGRTCASSAPIFSSLAPCPATSVPRPSSLLATASIFTLRRQPRAQGTVGGNTPCTFLSKRSLAQRQTTCIAGRHARPSPDVVTLQAIRGKGLALDAAQQLGGSLRRENSVEGRITHVGGEHQRGPAGGSLSRGCGSGTGAAAWPTDVGGAQLLAERAVQQALVQQRVGLRRLQRGGSAAAAVRWARMWLGRQLDPRGRPGHARLLEGRPAVPPAWLHGTALRVWVGCDMGCDSVPWLGLRNLRCRMLPGGSWPWEPSTPCGGSSDGSK